MSTSIMERVIKEANMMLETGKTVRELANILGVSKSTVHKDLHERLQDIDKEKYQAVDQIMKYHIDIRHLRGGESTKKKYQNLTIKD